MAEKVLTGKHPEFPGFASQAAQKFNQKLSLDFGADLWRQIFASGPAGNQRDYFSKLLD